MLCPLSIKLSTFVRATTWPSYLKHIYLLQTDNVGELHVRPAVLFGYSLPKQFSGTAAGN